MKKRIIGKITGILLTGILSASSLSGCSQVPEVPDEALDLLEQAVTELTGVNGQSGEGENVIFDITIPSELDGKYVMESYPNGYALYDREAKEADCGGFAFGVYAYEKPSDYAGGMDEKIGEIRKDGTVLYDIVLEYPSDVQYDVTKYQEKMPETYEALYHGAKDITAALQPKMDGEFVFGGGCNGAELYPEVLEKYITAVEEGWDADKLEQENMSPEYYALAQVEGENAKNLIGFAYLDLNHDGVDELMVGEMGGGAYNTTVYDIYTIVDRKPALVVSGSGRNRYYPLEYGEFINERSGGADESEWITYDIEPNTTNLIPQVGIKMDGYEDKDNPWFVIYGADEGEWESISEEDFDYYMDNFKYLKTNFTPLSEASTAGFETPVYETFKSGDGWSVTYDAGVINVFDSTDPAGETDFNYTGECGGTNLLAVSLVEGKLPPEMIEEIREAQSKDRKTSVDGMILPGTDDKWSYWISFDYPEEGSGYKESYLLTEYNKGTLKMQFIEHKSGDEETDIAVSDAFAQIVDSLEFENFGPQTMYKDIPGTYVTEFSDEIEGEEIKAEYTLTLKDDHRGTLSLQDDIEILWDDCAVKAADGSFRYFYTLKGDMLTLDYDGQEVVFQKK